MKEFCLETLAPILLILALLFLPSLSGLADTAMAQGVASSQSIVVKLNDGASIPYFDGFQSQITEGADAIQGITGAAVCIWEGENERDEKRETLTYELQNIALTDDVLAAFFLLRSEQPLQFPNGNIQHSYNWAVPYLDWMVDGDWLSTIGMPFREGHPLDAYTMACLAVYSLDEPLAHGKTLTLAPIFNAANNRYEGGISIQIDRSAANDTTRAYAPMTRLQKSLDIWSGEPKVDFDFVVERVAFTPFGNRILINYNQTSHQNAVLEFALLDDGGDLCPIAATSGTSHSLASKEHPQRMRNHAWFIGGEGSKSLTLVPVHLNAFSSYEDVIKQVVVPLDSLPGNVPLPNGGALHVESCGITEDGFVVAYTPEGLTNRLIFDLVDGKGASTGFNYVTFTETDLPHGRLQTGGYWSDEYKGKKVARVTPEELEKVQALLVECRVGEMELMEEEGITLPLDAKTE